MDKVKRINREKNRLKRLYKDLDEKSKQVTQGLIERAAYLRISLEDLEAFLDENDYVEKFKQGKDQEPYDRKRPKADMYVQLSTQYTKVIGELSKMLAKVKSVPENDAFADFVDGREDI